MAIRFFEQLAPAPATSAASAYAPVPPRFAPPLTEPDLEEAQLSAPSSGHVEAQSPLGKSHARATPPTNVAGQAEPAVEHTRLPSAVRSELAGNVVPAEATAPTRVIMRAATTTRSPMPPPGAPPSRVTSSTAAPSGDGSRAGVPAPLVESAPSQARDEPSSEAIVRPPLSERAATHVSAPLRADSHPVVHVTIDRIEVRAPAAQPPAPASRPKSRTPSSKPLGDYLRERNRTGGATP